MANNANQKGDLGFEEKLWQTKTIYYFYIAYLDNFITSPNTFI